jgi:hypothetical protein
MGAYTARASAQKHKVDTQDAARKNLISWRPEKLSATLPYC